MYKQRLVKMCLLGCIIFVHALLFIMLYELRPDKIQTPNIGVAAQKEIITTITFSTKHDNKKLDTKNQITNPKNNAGRILASNPASAEHINREDSFQQKTSDVAIQQRSNVLLLHLPETKFEFNTNNRTVFEKSRNPLDYQSTRFNHRWKPSGNAVDSLKWKSKTVNAVLGLFGGNRKICSDEDRRNQLAECVPNGYRPEYDTELPIQ